MIATTKDKNYSLLQKNHPIWIGGIILISILLRILWGVFFGREYWGDSYHNTWMLEQYLQSGDYVDYKDRHLVWLPLYRWLMIGLHMLVTAFGGVFQSWITPLILQLGYVFVAVKSSVILFNDRLKPAAIFVFTLLPLPILFSAFNMSEGLALVLIAAVILLVVQWSTRKSLFMIAILSMAIMLTRHEVTAFLGLISLSLFLHGKFRRALAIIFGVLAGIGVWSYFNYIMQGDALFWLTSKFTASGAGAKEAIESAGLSSRLLEVLLSTLLAFPLIIFLKGSIFVKSDAEISTLVSRKVNVPSFKAVLRSCITFLILFIIGSLFFFHSADAKYLLFLCYPLSIAIILSINYMRIWTQRVLVVSMFLFIGLVSIVFHARSFNLEAEREIGRVMQDISQKEMVWSDYPTTLVMSDWPTDKAISSSTFERLMKEEGVGIPEVMLEQNIQYVVASNASFSIVEEEIPQTMLPDDFIWGGYQFRRIGASDSRGWQRGNEGLWGSLKKWVMSQNDPVFLWEVEAL